MLLRIPRPVALLHYHLPSRQVLLKPAGRNPEGPRPGSFFVTSLAVGQVVREAAQYSLVLELLLVLLALGLGLPGLLPLLGLLLRGLPL